MVATLLNVWPQRINGRIAMIAFAGAAVAEAVSGKSILEQAAIAPISVGVTMFLISLASLFPKYSAGVSLSQLIDATGGSIKISTNSLMLEMSLIAACTSHISGCAEVHLPAVLSREGRHAKGVGVLQ